MSCVKNGWTDINDIYVNMTSLCMELPFGLALIAPALEFLVALIFLIVINSLHSVFVLNMFYYGRPM